MCLTPNRTTATPDELFVCGCAECKAELDRRLDADSDAEWERINKLSRAEVEAELHAAGIDPEASYNRLRTMLKDKYNIDTPPYTRP